MSKTALSEPSSSALCSITTAMNTTAVRCVAAGLVLILSALGIAFLDDSQTGQSLRPGMVFLAPRTTEAPKLVGLGQATPGPLPSTTEVRASTTEAIHFAIDKQVHSVFEKIAKTNSWGSGETISGAGSEMISTSTARVCLGKWIDKYSVNFLVDVPCGDGNWQGSIPGIDAIKYQGYDIAQAAVSRARVKNHLHNRMKFDHFDLLSNVPQGKPDLVLVRDVIQHLPTALGLKMLTNAKRSGAKWLVVSSFTGSGYNTEQQVGGMYENDVHEAPFNLPKAEEDCDNYSIQSGWFQNRDRLEIIDLAKWTPSVLNVLDRKRR